MTQSNLIKQISYSQFLGQITILNRIKLPTTRLFGTDGIRGKVGEKEVLNPALAAKVGFWTGQILQALEDCSLPVILGQDSRNSSDSLAMAMAEGLAAAGVEVWNLGLCPTPAVAYLTNMTKAMGGVMISASHNAPEDNGIKIFGANGTKLSSLVQGQIEAGIRGQVKDLPIQLLASADWGKQYYRSDLLKQYIQSMLDPFMGNHTLKGMKIVLDLAWGATVNIAPDVFKQMGASVIALHDRADGDRINVDCGSTHLAKLQQAVVEHQADLGFAFDGDGDRIMAVDSQGKVLNGDYILYFWGRALMNQGQLPHNTIVTTVMANLGLENAWKQLGGNFVRTAVGDRHVHAKMAELGAKLGGEQSGHILAPSYSVSGDGVLTALHIATLVKNSGKSLAQLLAQSFVPYPQILENVRVEDPEIRQNWQDCTPLQIAIAEAEAAIGDKGRILVRPSGTEPLIRVMVEAIDLDLAYYWATKLVACVEQYLVERS